MRHPFDGIIIPDSQPTTVGANRRSALRWFAGAVASLIAVLGGQHRAGANPPGSQNQQPGDELDPAAKRDKGYGLFFVVPRDVRRFNTARRKELGVNGTFADGWKGRADLAESRGFTAWMLPAEVERLSSESDVVAAHELKADDKVIVGNAAGDPAEITVTLSPNAWRVRPNRDTYLTGEELAAIWSKEFAEFGNVTVTPGRIDRNIEVRAKHGRLPDEVVAAIKADPQVSHMVYGLTYLTVPSSEEGRPLVATTKAVGEEGGRPPNVTTFAVGEEGGMTTKAVGEEGGRPPSMTTFAVGEEGGATTKAVGEEGGRPPAATTLAVGEEGGPRPPIRPTTKALGEEGAGRPNLTTFAAGEEGGNRPPPKTTKMVGEEGGRPR